MTARPFKLTAPAPMEREVHEACARALDLLLLPPAVWFTYPAGAMKFTAAQAARHSRIGLKRGLPDIWVLHDGVYCIELKRVGGQLSKTRIGRTRGGAPREMAGQTEVFPKLLAAGVKDIAICHSVDEVLGQLARWNVPLRGRVSA